MKIKVTKKKMVLVIVLIIVMITLPVFSRYIYENIRDMYLKSRNFSFSSNLLTTWGKTYKYSNWSGLENYEVDFKLYSYENELSLFTYEGAGLGYDVTAFVDDPTKATVHIDYTSGESSGNSYIPNETNVRDVKIFLKPTGNLAVGDILTLTVEAETTKPYKKKISANFKIQVSESVLSYKITDKSSDLYATLELVNGKITENVIKLAYNPELVTIDTSDECYINRVTQTTRKVDGIDYIDSVTITLEPEFAKNIKFYKKNINANYTYPGGTAEDMVITITEVN